MRYGDLLVRARRLLSVGNTCARKASAAVHAAC